MATKEEQYAVAIADRVIALFDEECESYRYSLEEIDATAFFTGFFLAFTMIYKRLTGDKGDLIDGVGLINRLVFQYLNRKKD